MASSPNQPNVMKREAIVIAKMLAPLIFILAIVAYFHDFVIHAINANVAINGLIIAAASYGVVLILIRLVNAQLDSYAIERFGREAVQGVYMRQLLEQPWLKKRYVRHYLGHIALTGGTLSSALDQNAIENELRALSSEYEHKLELPQFIVGFMIAMGLLGTFIGLLETLTGISGMLDGMGATGTSMDEQFAHLVVELRKPLAGMGIAFSASMFGLVTSLMLAIMMINLRRYVSHVVGLARNVMHDLTELSRGSSQSSSVKQLTPEEIMNMAGGGGPPKRAAAANIAEGDGELSLQDLVYQVNDTSLLVANRIDSLTTKLDALVQAVSSSIHTTQKMTDSLGFGMNMKELNEKILDELKVISNGQIEQHKFAQRFVDVTGDTARVAGGIIQAQRDAQADLAIFLRDLADKLVKIEESGSGVGRAINDVKENFMKLGSYSSVAEAISSSVGHQTLLLETLIKEDRNLQKRLVSIQQDLRERSLPPAGQADIVLPPV